MSRGAAAVLVTACVCVFAGCGGSRVSTLEFARPVSALALDGHNLAWISIPNELARDCRARLSFRTGAVTSTKWLPVRDACAADGSQILLTGYSAGWLIVDGHRGYRTAGVASPRHSPRVLIHEHGAEDVGAEYGRVLGGIAAGDGRILLGEAHVSWRGPLESFCDIDASGAGCRTRVDGGGVVEWSSGTVTRVRGLPATSLLVMGGGWIAFVPRPRGGWVPHLVLASEIDVLDVRTHQRVARIPLGRGGVDQLALSHTLAAVEDGFRTVRLYRLPGGRFVRRLRLPQGLSYEAAGNVAFTGDRLLVWDSSRVVAIDATTGRREVLAGWPGADGSQSAWHITALAVDGDRVAWALTDAADEKSLVRVVRLG